MMFVYTHARQVGDRWVVIQQWPHPKGMQLDLFTGTQDGRKLTRELAIELAYERHRSVVGAILIAKKGGIL